jgi:hypothetical protein
VEDPEAFWENRREAGHPHPQALWHTTREVGEGQAREILPYELPAHQFPQPAPSLGEEAEDEASAALEAWWELGEEERRRRLRRRRTVVLLQRYMRYAVETGRLPSLVGREFFRAKVTAYAMVSFEDRVIFVHDMEKCLERLDEFSRELIARHILQEHDQEATARLLCCGERTVRRMVPLVLDQLSEILLEVGMMEAVEKPVENFCQGGLGGADFVSDCEDGEKKF